MTTTRLVRAATAVAVFTMISRLLGLAREIVLAGSYGTTASTDSFVNALLLVNLVAAGYGTTLIPALAADSLGQRDIALRRLEGRSARTIRLASRPGFPRPQALRALEKVIRKAVRFPADGG